jgi:hypothetical protein
MSLSNDTSNNTGTFDPIPQLGNEEGNRRDKFLIEIDTNPYNSDSPSLEITLSMVLDENEPAERKIMDTFELQSQNLFVFRYLLGAAEINLAAERDIFAERLEKSYRQPGLGSLLKSKSPQLSDDKLRAFLAPLALQGDSVFNRLFLNPALTPISHEASDVKLIQEAIRSVLRRPNVISLKSSEPIFPWAFLYDGPTFDSDDHSSLDPGSFWGFKYEIQQDVGCTATRTRLPAQPKMFMAIDPYEDGGRHVAASHIFSHMNIVPATTRDELRDALVDFNNDILYFFGHANDAEQDYESWLKLQNVDLKVSELRRIDAPRFNNVPVLTFLNGCRTTPLRRWDKNTVVGYICLKQPTRRVCCVVTVAEVPAAFAVEFASHVWEGFWRDKTPLGSALLEARKKMLAKYNNPLGLLYSLFGSVDTIIIT